MKIDLDSVDLISEIVKKECSCKNQNHGYCIYKLKEILKNTNLNFKKGDSSHSLLEAEIKLEDE